MTSKNIKRIVIGTVLTAVPLGGVAVAKATDGSSTVRTPNQCIHLNHGDYNACNVGNSGTGSRPYSPLK